MLLKHTPGHPHHYNTYLIIQALFKAFLLGYGIAQGIKGKEAGIRAKTHASFLLSLPMSHLYSPLLCHMHPFCIQAFSMREGFGHQQPHLHIFPALGSLGNPLPASNQETLGKDLVAQFGSHIHLWTNLCAQGNVWLDLGHMPTSLS